jgi:hypothetical protein
MEAKLVKKTVRLEPEIVAVIDSKPKPAEYMRSAINNAVAKESNPKVYVEIEVTLTNNKHFNDDFTVKTILTSDFKSAILPFFEAVEKLQREIDRMNKEA